MIFASARNLLVFLLLFSLASCSKKNPSSSQEGGASQNLSKTNDQKGEIEQPTYTYKRIFGGCVDQNLKKGFNHNYKGQCSDYSDIDLSNQELRGANFNGSDFSNANFGKSDLSNAYLIGTNLKNANLMQNCNLKGAIFTEDTTLPFSKDVALSKGMIFKSTNQLDDELNKALVKGTVNDIRDIILVNQGSLYSTYYTSHYHHPAIFDVYLNNPNNKLEIIKLLVNEFGVDINSEYSSLPESCPFELGTILNLASAKDISELVKLGADPNRHFVCTHKYGDGKYRDEVRETVLSVRFKKNLFDVYLKYGDPFEEIKSLLAVGANPKFLATTKGMDNIPLARADSVWTAIHNLSGIDKETRLKYIRLVLPFYNNPNSQNELKHTKYYYALHPLVVFSDDEKATDLLLNLGVSPSVKDEVYCERISKYNNTWSVCGTGIVNYLLGTQGLTLDQVKKYVTYGADLTATSDQGADNATAFALGRLFGETRISVNDVQPTLDVLSYLVSLGLKISENTQMIPVPLTYEDKDINSYKALYEFIYANYNGSILGTTRALLKQNYWGLISPVLLDILVKHGLDLNQPVDGVLPIAACQDIFCIDSILESGINPNAVVPQTGETAIMQLLINRGGVSETNLLLIDSVVKKLVTAGADLRIQNVYGYDALAYSFNYIPYKKYDGTYSEITYDLRKYLNEKIPNHPLNAIKKITCSFDSNSLDIKELELVAKSSDELFKNKENKKFNIQTKLTMSNGEKKISNDNSYVFQIVDLKVQLQRSYQSYIFEFDNKYDTAKVSIKEDRYEAKGTCMLFK